MSIWRNKPEIVRRALLENRSTVLDLLGSNPFPDRPPRYVRALLYDYRFADRATHDSTGQWWVRKLEREFVSPTTLQDLSKR